MSKIKFCALGGLGENGKNCYVVTVDERIFVLDVGLKYPSAELFGIDSIVPDITYLVENRDKICGIFLSHGHMENIGGIIEVITKTEAPIYTTHFTASIVEIMIADANLKVSDYKIYRINDDKILKFGDVTVSFFNTSHSIPESLGISINTVDGSVVYAPDFTFSPSNDVRYRTSFNKITDISRNKTLILCSESLGCLNFVRANNDYTFEHTVNEILKQGKRVIFSMFSSNLNRIQKVIDLCVAHNKKIAIIGRKTQITVNAAMNIGYVKIPNDNLVNLKYITNDNKNDSDDLAIIITGLRHEPYYMLIRMLTNQDRLIQLKQDDNVVIVSPPVVGTEKIATKTKDALNRLGCKITSISKKSLKSSHASSEDLKMMYQLLSPKYIIPIVGEYRHQYQQKSVAISAGFNSKDIIMLDNGNEITFVDGVLQEGISKNPVGDVLIDGSIVGDINEVVLKDRELLSESGALICCVNINSNKRTIVSGPKIVARGFVPQAIIGDIVENLENVAFDIVKKMIKKKSIDWNELKNSLKDGISKEIIDSTNKNPVVIPLIVDMCEEEIFENKFEEYNNEKINEL